MNSKKNNEPKILKNEIIYESKYIKLNNMTFHTQSGVVREYEYVIRPDSSMVITLTKNGLYFLVKEYRYAARKYFVQFPIETKENTESYLECAKRGLYEEVGIRAKEWILLGSFYSDPGISYQQCQVFLAKEIVKSNVNNSKEDGISIVRMGQNEINDLIKSGNIDSWTIAAWQLYDVYLNKISK